MKYFAYLIIILTIGLNFFLYYPETQITADPNDNVFQFSLVRRTDWIWSTYHCPFSFSCIPNLFDHVVTTWAEGYPLPFYYSHIPQIMIVSTYHLVINPLCSIVGAPCSLFSYYHWITYILLCIFPLSVFLALRIVGFAPVVSAISAVFATHLSTDGLYGIDPTSFLWRGYGLISQLYAMIWMPLALAYTYTAVSSASTGKKPLPWNYIGIAILMTTLTTSGHLGLGMMTLLSFWPFLFLDFSWKGILKRTKILAYIGGGTLFLLSYWILPILQANNYHIISFWDPIWKFYSYGAYEVIRQYISGELFDFGRYPYITTLVTIGWFAITLKPKRMVFGILFAFWFLMYFGHTTWGGLIDIIPGLKDFHQHRFLVALQIAGLFLIPAGLETIQLWVVGGELLVKNVIKRYTKTNTLLTEHHLQLPIFLTIVGILLSLTIQQTIRYNSLNTKWIGEANTAFRYSEKEFNTLITDLHTNAKGRIYAGRPGNWGKQLRIGSTELYMQLGLYGLDISQFLPETWSPLSENDQDFDERTLQDYDLLNIRDIVTDKNHDFPKEATLVATHGPYQHWTVPTKGWFDVVSSPMMVTTDKTNFINIVHYWHRSYARSWGMHPLISVESHPPIPFPLRKTIHMTDEVSYVETPEASSLQPTTNNQPPTTNHQLPTTHNIFSDYPFVFPEATISAHLVSESVQGQTYTGVVDVPDPCPSCMVMFKMSYHPNWRVTIDGVSAQKYAVFPFFLATTATPGRHTIQWTYQPNRLKIVLLLGTTILLVGFFIQQFFFFKKLIRLSI